MSAPAPLELPNVREMFIPEPGFIFIEADLSGADARVAACECGGQFRADFLSDVKIHQDTQRWFANTFMKSLLTNPEYPKVEPWYTRHKNWIFGSLYGGKPPTISSESGSPIAYVKAFQPYLANKYPTIPGWHKRVERELATTRSVRNIFGYSIPFFDRIEGLLPEALAWIPQSTVAIACNRGLMQVREQCPWARIKLQVHDSGLFSIPRDRWRDLPLIRRAISVSLPYPDGTVDMPWSFKASERSWGHCESVNWDTMELAA